MASFWSGIQPQELGPCSSTVDLNFMACTKPAQTARTANPSLTPPLHRELPTTLSKASRLIFSPWCHPAEMLGPK